MIFIVVIVSISQNNEVEHQLSKNWSANNGQHNQFFYVQQQYKNYLLPKI